MTTLELSGGRVLRPDLTVAAVDVLVDADAGTVLEVGDLAGTGDDRLDCSGSLVMPGLVNAHGHGAMTLLRGYADDKPLEAWLEEDIWPAETALEADDVGVGTRLAAAEMIRSGTTGFVDMYFRVDEVVEAVAEAGLRARVGHGVVTLGKDEAAAREDFRTSLNVAERHDGAADGRVRTAVMPHAPHTVGTAYFEEFIPEVVESGLGLHFHMNETAAYIDAVAEEYGGRPTVYAADLGLLGPDSWVAHAVHVDESEIDLLAETGTGVVHCPASNMKLASGMAPVQTMLNAGVTVGLGTDGAASNNDLDMFDEMRDAAMLGKLAADDAAAVAAPDVVQMATEGSAAAAGLPVGGVEAGAPADFAVVDFEAPHLTPAHDPVSHLVYAARGSDVRHTVCDGQVLMAEREVRTLDVAAVRETADEHAAALVDRAG